MSQYSAFKPFSAIIFLYGRSLYANVLGRSQSAYRNPSPSSRVLPSAARKLELQACDFNRESLTSNSHYFKPKGPIMIKKSLLITPLVLISFCAFGMEEEFEKGTIIQYTEQEESIFNFSTFSIREKVGHWIKIKNDIAFIFFIPLCGVTHKLKKPKNRQGKKESFVWFGHRRLQDNSGSSFPDERFYEDHTKYQRIRKLANCIYNRKTGIYTLKKPKRKWL